MTLQSEQQVQVRPGVEALVFSPGPLMAKIGGGKHISRLQFEAVEMLQAGTVADCATVSNLANALCLEDELAATGLRGEPDATRHGEELAAAYTAGRLEGRGDLENEFAERVAAEKALVIRTVSRFKEERESYFSAVEGEVVKLALEIAARILHREVRLDPLLLQAVVKVALGKVADESGVLLRVPMSDESAWRRLIEEAEAADVKVLGDSRQQTGDCVLETSVGRVELGVAAQLAEIERGFFDLLQQRPA